MRQWDLLEDRTISALETLKAASAFDHSKKFDKAPLDQVCSVCDFFYEKVSLLINLIRTPNFFFFLEQEADPAVRKERKQWVKMLQRMECVDAASYEVLAEALRDVSIVYCQQIIFSIKISELIFLLFPVSFSFPCAISCHLLPTDAAAP